MSAADGYVGSTTKVVDHGPDSARWTLVIVGDGYQAGQLATYHADVEAFLAQLRGTAPYTDLFCGINVYRVDVVSTDSGADEPTDCGGPGTTPRTYFDATFCSVGPGGVRIERLLTVDSVLAATVAKAAVAKVNQVMAIVNSSKYGGSGGEVATCSNHASAAEIAIHEIGHSAFKLADEYGGNGVGTPAGEPLEPNATRDTNRATNKWRDLIAAGTPMPSSCDAACAASACVPPPSAPPAGAVGAFEGAIYSDCNLYRPAQECTMRTLETHAFCPVCTRVIRQALLEFQPAESINLLTPSIAFTHVPAGMGGVGVTTHRAIVFEVVTCRTLSFEMVAGPSGGFGTPLGRSVSVTTDPLLPAASARLWLSYTSTSPGSSASGSVTVRCPQTLQTWVINIVADTIARPRAAVVLILDRSGSMQEDAGSGTTKVQQLREAANVFVNLMLPNDGIGLVTFNETATRLMEVAAAGPASGGAGRAAALAHISGSALDPLGQTSIGDGVVKGKQMLDDAQAAASPSYDVLAQLVLTDGMWNRPPDLASITGSISATTHAIGLGLPSNISVPALSALCQGHNGFLRVTGVVTPEQTMRLSKYFLQVLAGVTNAQIAADPRGVLDLGAEHRIPFRMCEADYGMDCIVLSPWPGVIDFELEAPDGTRITPAAAPPGANAQFVASQYTAFYRCALPLLPANADGSHAGQWHAVLKLARRQPGFGGDEPRPQGHAGHYVPGRAVLPYEFVAQAYSNLVFRAVLTQSGFDVGACAYLTAILEEYDVPLRERAQVWAEILRPDGSTDVVALADEGGARFRLDYRLGLAGLYAARIRARGDTMRGTLFERETTLTAVATPGGDLWRPELPRPDAVCELLHCLRRRGVLGEELLRRLRQSGIDLPALLDCLEAACRPADGGLEAPAPHAGAHAGAGNLPLEQLAELIAARLRTWLPT